MQHVSGLVVDSLEVGGVDISGGVVRVGAGARIGALVVDEEGRLATGLRVPRVGRIPWFTLPPGFHSGLALTRDP